MYIELHTSSAFSFLDGASLPEALVERAAALGYPAIALLDRDGVYGAPRFHIAAKRAGLRGTSGRSDDDFRGSRFVARGSKPARSTEPRTATQTRGSTPVLINRSGLKEPMPLVPAWKSEHQGGGGVTTGLDGTSAARRVVGVSASNAAVGGEASVDRRAASSGDRTLLELQRQCCAGGSTIGAERLAVGSRAASPLTACGCGRRRSFAVRV